MQTTETRQFVNTLSDLMKSKSRSPNHLPIINLSKFDSNPSIHTGDMVQTRYFQPSLKNVEKKTPYKAMFFNGSD